MCVCVYIFIHVYDVGRFYEREHKHIRTSVYLYWNLIFNSVCMRLLKTCFDDSVF